MRLLNVLSSRRRQQSIVVAAVLVVVVFVAGIDWWMICMVNRRVVSDRVLFVEAFVSHHLHFLRRYQRHSFAAIGCCRHRSNYGKRPQKAQWRRLTIPTDSLRISNPLSLPTCLKYASSVARLDEEPEGDFDGSSVNDSAAAAAAANVRTSGSRFELTTPYQPTGDQPQAIETLVRQIERGDRFSVLRGITGSGKSFVMANTIAQVNRPTLILCHNKTLAAQLARELRSCLSKNRVHLFVSYYNHYVPESYNEKTDRYTKKKSSINDELDALRHLATRSLVQHRDVVVVSSVSCIYGLGMPRAYLDASVNWTVGHVVGETLTEIHETMASLLYMTPEEAQKYSTRNTDDKNAINAYDDELNRGNYQLSDNNDVASLMIWPPSESFPLRVDMTRQHDGYRITSIGHGHSTGMTSVTSTTIFPAKHHIKGSQDQFDESLQRIQQELQTRVKDLIDSGKTVEANRLSHRVSQDLLLLRETGTCSGVENYSRHIALREEGEPPDTLLDYFGHITTSNGHRTKKQDWLLIVDESHVTLPQLKAMYGGDRSRKERLVKHGFRLPSALDNRPLRSEEFWRKIPQAVFVSATPARHELDLIAGTNEPIEMVIRPTFVCDPEITIRSTTDQLDDLLSEIRIRAKRHERTLAMTLTKRDAEDLASYLLDHGVSSTYIHSGMNTHERSEALKSLQHGEIDCLVGVNLLREGLDLPQVSFVAILNADSEGFLRSETALLQTIGRAARNTNGHAALYANRVTDSMQKCIDATAYRREIQLNYNKENGKEMKSTKGSSALSIFDLLKDQIEAEKPNEVVRSPPNDFHKGIELEPNHRIVSKDMIETDHLPSKPGVYMWKDEQGNILYIGKAKKLRNRVKSYLAQGAKHTPRIRTMLSKAQSVEFMLCPSDRDALVLENNMIKHHQPLYNVLLKDDDTYPSICATVGDPFPTFMIVPRRLEGERASKYKYFGPYPHYAEINRILQGIEEVYDLRSKSFQARFGDVSKADYQRLFQKALNEVFESKIGDSELATLRSNYEEASLLFGSEYNESTDIVAVGKSNDGGLAVVHVLQLRSGLIAGQFSYECQLGTGLILDDDFADAIQLVLEKRHYLSGGSPIKNGFSFFPDEILLQVELPEPGRLQDVLRSSQQVIEKPKKIKIRTPVTRGPRRQSDARCMQCAVENAIEVANQKALVNIENAPLSSVDGRAIKELAQMLSLENIPHKIECYDISHTQGVGTVGSRVVYVDGQPRRDLYRSFNVRSVDRPDDYASLEEVLERRFQHIWLGKDTGGALVDESDPWSIPDLIVIDGGKGQLSAAIKGMSKSNVLAETISLAVSDPVSLFDDNVCGGENDVEIVDGDFCVAEEEYQPRDGTFVRVPIVALAKKNEEVFVNGRSNPLIDVDSGSDSSALLLLRAIRDESHRFALTAHRRRRKKSMGL